MSNSQQDEVKSKEQAEQEKLLAIRDIIFGNEIKEYNREFGELKDLIDKNKEATDQSDKELLEKIQQTQKELTNKLDDMDKRFSAAVAELTDAKADRKQLGAMLEEIAKKLQA